MTFLDTAINLIFQHYAEPNSNLELSLNRFKFNDFIGFGSIQASFEIRFEFGPGYFNNAEGFK